jgi:decaprenylphospho-beta-D-ribofuranose 2-oxidase
VGWIDAAAPGAGFGRGILETAEPDGAPIPAPTARALAVPFDLPHLALNPLTVRLFNAAYWRRVPRAGRTRLLPAATFLWPLDRLRNWNRVYGRRGFIQFQCVLPHASARDGLRALLQAAAGRASPLAVLKRMGEGRAGMLSFPRAGCTLALDFPRAPGIEMLHARLVAVTLDHGGRTYLAKDSLLDPLSFRRMYPELPEFQSILHRIDPDARFTSDMAQRLRLRETSP